MQFGIQCAACMLAKQADFAKKQGDSAKGLAYFKAAMRAVADAPEGVGAPYLTPVFNRLAEQYYGITGDRYTAEKEHSNQFMLARMDEIRSAVMAAEDPFKLALRYAQTCNYIDFGALYNGVSFDELDALLSHAAETPIDDTEYQNFVQDLKQGRHLLYLCDNAGEIVIDRIVAEVLRQQYPHVQLTFCVRGAPALNDALRADAELVGLQNYAQVIDNGTGIPGTELACCSDALRHAFDTADVVLAKGMGNFETMHGCGKNVYYLFLCKCVRFQEMFGVKRLTGMFVNERRVVHCDYVD